MRPTSSSEKYVKRCRCSTFFAKVPEKEKVEEVEKVALFSKKKVPSTRKTPSSMPISPLVCNPSREKVNHFQLQGGGGKIFAQIGGEGGSVKPRQSSQGKGQGKIFKGKEKGGSWGEEPAVSELRD